MEPSKNIDPSGMPANAQKIRDISKYIKISQSAARGWAQVGRNTTSEFGRRLGSTLKRWFLIGLKVIIPLGITIFVLVWVFKALDNILQPIFRPIFDRTIPGLGLLSGIIIILVLGIIVSTVFGRRMMEHGEKGISKIPIVRSIYGGTQQIVNSFSSTKEKGTFMRVVLIEFPKEGMKTVGLVTNEFISESGEVLLNVYIPTAPNPTSGFLQIVNAKDVIPTNMTIDEAMKMVMSAGKISANMSSYPVQQEPPKNTKI